MPYDTPGMGGAMDAPAAADSDQGEESQEKGNTIHVAASDLPKGVEPKAGSKVVFCITGPPDAENDVPGYLEPYEGGDREEEGEGDGTSWEQDFMKHMSPREGGGQDQQEPM